MNEFPPYLALTNLPRFLEYRGLRLTEPADGVPRRDVFKSRLTEMGSFRVVAESHDAPPRVTVLFLLDPHGKYSQHVPDLRKLIQALQIEPFSKEGRLAEVILLSHEDVPKKSHFKEALNKLRTTAEYMINLYPFSVFTTILPEVQAVPEHVIASAEEVQELLRWRKLRLADLKKISAHDPPVVWLGARPQDVVRIAMPSESAGTAYDYRVVV